MKAKIKSSEKITRAPTGGQKSKNKLIKYIKNKAPPSA